MEDVFRTITALIKSSMDAQQSQPNFTSEFEGRFVWDRREDFIRTVYGRKTPFESGQNKFEMVRFTEEVAYAGNKFEESRGQSAVPFVSMV